MSRVLSPRKCVYHVIPVYHVSRHVIYNIYNFTSGFASCCIIPIFDISDLAASRNVKNGDDGTVEVEDKRTFLDELDAEFLSTRVSPVQECQVCHPMWVILAPNGTNLGLFKISSSTFWLGEPKCTETDF